MNAARRQLLHRQIVVTSKDNDEDTDVKTADDEDDETTNSETENDAGTDKVRHADTYSKMKWILQNFITPLKVRYQLSGYPHLLWLYWILCTLPVTSCSLQSVH